MPLQLSDTSAVKRLCVACVLCFVLSVAAVPRGEVGATFEYHTQYKGAYTGPSDPAATPAAGELFQLLANTSASRHFFFGQHNTNYNGQNWSVQQDLGPFNRSDILFAINKFPGMVEFNLDWITPFSKRNKTLLLEAVNGAVDEGSLIQFYWQSKNPVTGNSAYDVSGNATAEIMPGGKVNQAWIGAMDSVVSFLKGVKAPAIVLRLFHENTGEWFWWGSGACTPSEYRAAYNYTASYLRNAGLHNLLLAYAPSKPSQGNYANVSGYENTLDTNVSRYPGDNLVDVACFDRYDPHASDFSEGLPKDCEIAAKFAQEHGKLFAICEFGVTKGLQTAPPDEAATWWDLTFLNTVVQSPACMKAAFALTWQNLSPSNYYVPIQNEIGYASFAAFANSTYPLFAPVSPLPHVDGQFRPPSTRS